MLQRFCFSTALLGLVLSNPVLAAPTHATSAHATPAKAAPAKAAPAKVSAAKPAPTSCTRLSARLPGISTAMCRDSALIQSGTSSRNGFPILSRQIHPVANPASHAAPLRILLIGGIHGDELTASAAVFQWMQWMHNPEARHLDWDVVPVVNPDGLLAAKPRRVNANGVDLNRNFPTPDWQVETTRYWVTKTRRDPRRFPGSKPLSEPESRWVSDEIKRYRPQLIISVHAPFGLLDFDGSGSPPQQFGALRFNPIGVYPGSLGNYSGLRMHVPVLTIELPNAQTMPPNEEMRRIWRDMLTWIERNVAQPGAVAPLALGPGPAPVTVK